MTMTQEQAEKMVDAFEDAKTVWQSTLGISFEKEAGYRNARAALIAALTAGPGVPDGWKLVPEVPAPEMIEKGANCITMDCEYGTRANQLYEAEDCYQTMIAAAPPAPAVITRDVTTAAPDHIPDTGKMVADAVAAEVSNKEALDFLSDYDQTLAKRIEETGCADGAAQEVLQRFIRAREQGGVT